MMFIWSEMCTLLFLFILLFWQLFLFDYNTANNNYYYIIMLMVQVHYLYTQLFS